MTKSKTKRGKLTRNEKFIIEGLINEGQDNEYIMEYTNRSKTAISKIREDMKASVKADAELEEAFKAHEEQLDEAVEVKGEPANKKDKTLFHRTTFAKKDKGVTIMTAPESFRGDANKTEGRQPNQKIKQTFHVISPDKKVTKNGTE